MSDGDEQSAEPDVGGRLGRYRLLEQLGVGGMGVVYRAYDEELDRLIALKILREEEATRQEARDRLLREGRAIARLHHPNVVKVHDVDMAGGRLFLAMELVAGPSLGQWLAQRARSWRDVLPVLIDAGEGLAAAHDAGLVHRDFKPANVLVDTVTGADASAPRVRVADFGLARTASSWGVEAPSTAAHESGAPLAGVTERGAVVGTPPYMAPEQHLGEPPGPRADQFAFCVTLWEAIHGTRPFAGASRQELMANAARGKVTAARQRVPRWLRAVLLRGLQAEPHRRYPSMHELLRDLRRRPVVALWSRIAIASAAAIGLAALLGYLDTLQRREACAVEAAAIVGAWDGGASPSTDHAGRTVAQALDDHARALELVARETCEARRLHGEERRESTERCLADRAADLEAWTAMLATADERAAGQAVDALPLLGSPTRCRHADPTAAVSIRNKALADARALLAFGKPAETSRVLEAAGAEDAEASLLRGLASAAQGRLEPARAALWEAIWSAEAASQDLLGAQAWVEQVRVAEADIESIARLAEFAIGKAGGDEELAFSLALLQAERASAEGEPADAVAILDGAPAPAELRSHELLRARALRLRGEALLALQRDDEAASELVRALALTGDLYGPEHPRVAECERALAAALDDH